nr:MAG TPA: hypothetical protein [Caudoviricetes sp.]
MAEVILLIPFIYRDREKSEEYRIYKYILYI